MSQEIIDRLGEINDKLNAIAGQLKDNTERTEASAKLMEEIHGAWCLEIEREKRVLPEKVKAAVGPGAPVSWTDPTDASNVAWGGTVEFVGLDQAGTPIAHVDFARYGRRNLPVDELIIGILT